MGAAAISSVWNLILAGSLLGSLGANVLLKTMKNERLKVKSADTHCRGKGTFKGTTGEKELHYSYYLKGKSKNSTNPKLVEQCSKPLLHSIIGLIGIIVMAYTVYLTG